MSVGEQKLPFLAWKQKQTEGLEVTPAILSPTSSTKVPQVPVLCEISVSSQLVISCIICRKS